MTATADNTRPKSGKAPVFVGIILALLGAVGGFFVIDSGLVHFGQKRPPALAPEPEKPAKAAPNFVPMPPLLISLGPGSQLRHLRFSAQLETPAEAVEVVTSQMPRIVDVANTYLRALESSDFDDPAILLQLRRQLLRRVQLVVGPENVHDFLIMEFVLD